MGEVYKARDTRLNRTVAIKVLPRDFSDDADRRQRFEREARLVASLSHPHICALHDVGVESARAFLVMEYLEGETLADRLARGALPHADVIRHGREIALALEAAHRRHIVHRDLKPGNIMLTRSGVKLLDFGLAKSADPGLPGDHETLAITGVTVPGTVMGTVPYMAPEQLEGKPADQRSDIFALGAVLYEMATGRRAFSGSNPAVVSSAILTAQPPADTQSPTLDRIIRTCLDKDPDRRWQSAHDVALQLEGLDARSDETQASPRAGGYVPWTVAAIASSLAVAAVIWAARHSPDSSVGEMLSVRGAVAFPLPPPPGGAFFQSFEGVSIAVSPDGRTIAYGARAAEGRLRLWLRQLTSTIAKEVEGTEGATGVFWSPDSRSLAFFAAGKLKKLDLAAGGPVTICDVPEGIGQTGTWGAAGRILFASVGGESIQQISTSGGTPVDIVKPDPSRKERRVFAPHFLPDGRHYLYTIAYADDSGAIVLAGPQGAPRELVRAKSNVQYMDPGYLLYALDSALVARRFDPATGQGSGDAIAVADVVSYFRSTGFATFSASRAGVVVLQPHLDESRLAWFDRRGQERGVVSGAAFGATLNLSPDGRRVLFGRLDPRLQTADIWQFDFERGVESRLTSHPGAEFSGQWGPEGTIIFSTTRGSAPRLYRKTLATGKEDPVSPEHLGFKMANAVSADGRWLLYAQRTARGNSDLMALPFRDGEAVPVRVSDADEGDGKFSPNGTMVSFMSDESGRDEVHVTPFPAEGSSVPLFTARGRTARWSRDGRELFYISDDDILMAAPVRTAPFPHIGKAVPLGSAGAFSGWGDFDVAPDGRFLAVVRTRLAAQQPMTVIVNWPASISRQ
jgi:Tol biopolymer transport system component